MRERWFRESYPAESFVLAGGAGRRMGTDKALIPLFGQTLIERALETLRVLSLAAAPRIAGSRPDLRRFAVVLDDLHPGCGPLSGIEAALTASAQPLNLLLAVDLPLVPAGFLDWMLSRSAASGALLTCPRSAGRTQPLCAIYHKDLLPGISQARSAGRLQVERAIRRAADRLSPFAPSIDVFDLELVVSAYPELHAVSRIPVRHWLQNCNTPEDLLALRKMI